MSNSTIANTLQDNDLQKTAENFQNIVPQIAQISN
jgi:hypothetical protein